MVCLKELLYRGIYSERRTKEIREILLIITTTIVRQKLVSWYFRSHCAGQDGSKGDDALFSVTAVVDGVVGSGHCNGKWGGSTSSEGYDFAAVKLYSNGTLAWRWHVKTIGMI